jgi:c(7)-type cytochrome triheme protein
VSGRLTERLRDESGGISIWKVLLVVILGLGLWAALVRFSQGLGAATNLSDEFPWGLWIGFDVLVGVGLAAGGFVIAATVHVFHIEKYESISRPTILTAFLGYMLVIVGLLFDLGMPHRIWHPLIMWNHHSAMFEIGWCVMLYTTVLALEFSPLVFEKFGLKVPLKLIRAVYVPLVIAGVLLSTLHQSSLGTLYVIAEGKLHGLWYTPLLPLFFFISAIAGGLAMTIFESCMSYRAFGKRLEKDLLHGLARVAVVVLAVYAAWRLMDMVVRGNFHLIFQITEESALFWGEFGLGVILPMIIFAVPRLRHTDSGLFLGAMLTIMGFILNRINVAVTGMLASSGAEYTPSWMEFSVSMAIVAMGFVLFAMAVKYLVVFPEEKGEEAAVEPTGAATPQPIFGRGVLMGLWGLLLVGFVIVTQSAGASGRGLLLSSGDEPQPVAGPEVSTPAGDLRLPEPFAFPASEDSPGTVTFDHSSHVDTTAPNCGECHAADYSIEQRGRPLRGEWSFERIHEGDLCASCHDGERSFAVADDCGVCHW